jgi:hypothetical protein
MVTGPSEAELLDTAKLYFRRKLHKPHKPSASRRCKTTFLKNTYPWATKGTDSVLKLVSILQRCTS